ncbi:Glycosyl transferase family protein [Perkinsela sp. CCAP 1560/4]|nr:Glycosyl transferase family protein [Perkinsela sp. CCAP 1560/4]|eukprot:KNH01407.1 Glycosyl transferase family protein [Perkinsela sp. CCAP 1560/4]
MEYITCLCREDRKLLLLITSLSAFAHLLTHRLIKASAENLLKGGLFGIDLNKTTAKDYVAIKKQIRTKSLQTLLDTPSLKSRMIPESAGIIVGCAYISTVLVISWMANLPLLATHASMCSITTMLLVGFVDDVLGLRWALKIVFSVIACAPLVNSDASGRFLVLPVPFRGGIIQTICETILPGPHAGFSLGLGYWHTVIVTLICVFCTNAINIYAGVNGLEAGQSVLISLNVIVYSFLHLTSSSEIHRFWNIALLQFPFIAVSTALFRLNMYPAKVFVGDSFTYFAGMVFAVTAISNTFSKTLMLFLIPQILNFLFSLPQLFGFMHCPLHRIPRWDCHNDRLVHSNNLTLLNAVLRCTGPLHEKSLTTLLLVLQAACGALGLLLLELVRFFY